MNDLQQYLIGVIAVCIICGIINTIVGNKGADAGVIKTLTGIFLVVTLISPVFQFDFHSVVDYFQEIAEDSERYVASDQVNSDFSMDAIIKEQTEAYILDKAASMKLSLEVDVTLSDSEPPIPIAVTLSGPVSPYARSMLSQIIEDDLGISKENQVWKQSL